VDAGEADADAADGATLGEPLLAVNINDFRRQTSA
jgi:hypothetical protein